MKFLATPWLWGLFILPILYFVIAWDEGRKKKRFSQFVAEPVWKTLSPELDWGARLRKARLWLLAMGFMFLALARPQWGMHEETNRTTGLDVMIALDLSNSMEVEDVAPSRLKKAKHLLKSLIEKLEGDRVGLTIFAGGSYLASPLTLDLAYVLSRLQMVTPKFIPSQGTDIGLGLNTAFRALDRAAEDLSKPDPGQGNAPSRVIILVTDGEDHEDEAFKSAQQIKASGAKLYVLGVGTEKGAPIPVHDENGNLLTYKKDKKGQPIISSFKPDALLQLASAAGGRYWNVSVNEAETDELLTDMGALNRGEFQERKYLVYEERYYIPLGIAVLLILLELGIPVRRLVTLILLGMGLYTISPRQALAATSVETYLKNEKGLKAFGEGKVEEAQKSFGEAQALSPTQPELNYNQGVVNLKKGNTDAAIQSFQEASRESMAANDRTLLGKSLYNLGGALTKKGDTRGAIRAYLGAINSAQSTKDEKLEDDARKNLQLLAQNPPPKQQSKDGKSDQKSKDQQNQSQDQKQSQSQNGQGDSPQKSRDQKPSSDPDKKDGKSGEQDKNQNEKKDSGQQKKGESKPDQPDQKDAPKDPQQSSSNEAKQNEDPNKGKGKGFKSGKMSQDDADRVMEELKNREKELESRLTRRQVRAQNNDKDW